VHSSGVNYGARPKTGFQETPSAPKPLSHKSAAWPQQMSAQSGSGGDCGPADGAVRCRNGEHSHQSTCNALPGLTIGAAHRRPRCHSLGLGPDCSGWRLAGRQSRSDRRCPQLAAQRYRAGSRYCGRIAPLSAASPAPRPDRAFALAGRRGRHAPNRRSVVGAGHDAAFVWTTSPARGSG
jgi:hypothetical protein